MNKKESSFYYIIYDYFWCFLIGSIIGFIFESILSYYQMGYIINKQELVFGPFMPVYGIGTIIFMYISKHIKSFSMTFLLTFSLGGFIEFFYSLFQELIFGTLSWDYSDTPFNVQGRIALIYCVFWGLIGIISCKFILPYFKTLLYFFKGKFKIITTILIIFIIFNIILTSIALIRQKQRYFNVLNQSFIAKFLDKYYPDKKMDNIFENQVKLYTTKNVFFKTSN